MIKGKLNRIGFVILSLGALFIFNCIFLFQTSMSKVKGYAGYCSYVEIPVTNVAISIEIVLLSLSLVYLTLLVVSDKNKTKIASFVNIAIPAIILNLCFMAFLIFEFPRVLSVSNIGLPGHSVPENDQFLGLDYNPLIIIFYLFSIVMIVVNYVFLRQKNKNIFNLVNWITFILMFLAVIIIATNVEYEMCQG